MKATKLVYLWAITATVLAIAGCGDKQAPTNEKSVSKHVAAKVADPQPMSLGVTPAQFQERFSALAAPRKSEFRITNTQLKPSTDIADSWQYSFTNRVGFLAPVNRADGWITST